MEMSQRNRIVLATVALVAALALAAPAPSRAAGLPWNLPAVDRLERAWDRIARLLAGGSRTTAVRREKEGGVIDPNGGKTGVSPQVPTASSPQSHVGGN